MKSDYVKSSPHLFGRIKVAFAACCGLLMLAALFVPAPLQEPANIAVVPNPSKSAWFLLWMQELVAYSKYLVYLILAVGLSFLLLPYLPGMREARRARWFAADQKWVNVLTLVTFVAIVALTVVAMFFRGKNWSFVW